MFGRLMGLVSLVGLQGFEGLVTPLYMLKVNKEYNEYK